MSKIFDNTINSTSNRTLIACGETVIVSMALLLPGAGVHKDISRRCRNRIVFDHVLSILGLRQKDKAGLSDAIRPGVCGMFTSSKTQIN